MSEQDRWEKHKKLLAQVDAMNKIQTSSTINMGLMLTNAEARIAALENLVGKFLKLESSGTSVCQSVEESCCPYCEKEHFGSIEHEPNCLFITARVVLEGK